MVIGKASVFVSCGNESVRERNANKTEICSYSRKFGEHQGSFLQRIPAESPSLEMLKQAAKIPHELRLNGSKVGDHVLDPGVTDYEKRILYATYDVTNELKDGPNTVGGRQAKLAEGVKLLETQEGTSVFEVGSGDYEFAAS